MGNSSSIGRLIARELRSGNKMKDEHPAPTTRETADHAELASVIKYLRREAASNKAKRSGQAHGAHFVTRARKLNQAASGLEALLSEIAALRGDLTETRVAADLLVSSVRADLRQAERQRDELREWKREAMEILEEADIRLGVRGDTLEIITSDFLSRTRIANQGADQ